ncbi:MAG TPA: hypothetical protein VKD91_06475 [Pyrinomonadaceae bacterium]|nr:hypothetical protein [Pyrinomonadaceae bacterium]
MKTLRLLLPGCVFLVVGLVVVYCAWLVKSGRPGHTDFYWRRTKYERVVAKARALPLAPGAEEHNTIDGFKVDIARNRAGALTVTITTLDLHHFGMYGYVFSDVPLTQHPNGNYPDLPEVDNPGDMPFADQRIIGQQGRWWSVYNNLT